LDLFLLNKN